MLKKYYPDRSFLKLILDKYVFFVTLNLVQGLLRLGESEELDNLLILQDVETSLP
jgi:hypothetical protein